MTSATTPVTLSDLILPGTPESVAHAYATLAERAEHTSFGLLEEDLIVLDTETTGLSFKDCTLIEISAARISGGRIADRFETFVDPGRPIPPEIVALTGITSLDVAGAPSAEEAVRDLAEFCGGMPVIAHNATFDRTFVEKVRGGREVSDVWIDSLALSRIALPRLRSHSLSDMAAAFGCDSVTHRAGDDVDALCGMWRIILMALSDLPRGLAGLFAGMHEEVEWPYRAIFSHLALEDPSARFSLKSVRKNLVSQTQPVEHADARERLEPFEVPSRAEICELFGRGGMVSRMYEEFEPRPEQVAMALEVRDALATSTHRAIEAGTGVGKSMAYLVPEVLFAQRNNLTVGIATKTNALTDQLVSHELPLLDKALPGGVSFFSLKGYDHYPCLHRMERAALGELPPGIVHDGRSEESVASDLLTALAVTYAYVCQSPEGDLDALGIRWRYVPRTMLTTTSGECLRTKCPYFPGECLVHGARRRAAGGDVVVTNHSLLLRNVAADGKILPPVRHWVIDEAHAFEAEARRQWAVEVSGDEARMAFEQLGGTKTGVLHAALSRTASLEGSTLVSGLLTKAAAASARAQVATADLFECVHDLGSVARGDSGYDSVTLWLGDEVRETPEWAAVSEAGLAACMQLDEAAKCVAEAVERMAEVVPQTATDLAEAGRFLRELHDGIRLICEGADETYVYSAQLSRSKRRIGAEKLVAEKIDVGADLGKDWLPETLSAVFTSATMAVGEDFKHFDHAVGLDTLEPGMHRDVHLDSSFDFNRSMASIVAHDMPQPTDRAYLPALEDLLFDVHVAMGGSVLTLFTNRREMERVFEGLAPRLRREGLELDCQERGSSPRRIRERFLADKTLSLFALKSFWEGFDAAGETLRCVVIPKLPFASPNDPLVRVRELIEGRGSWFNHSLPEAVISVKQAAGRLIRTSTDRGVLVIADSRVAQKRYGAAFTNSLPTHDHVRIDRANVGRYIKMWRASHER